MKFIPLIIICSLFNVVTQAQNILISNNAAVSFFSSTILEDIEGKSSLGSSAINANTGDIIFKVPNTSFRFKKKLMQEHFNENYMESDKYPVSEFKGKLEKPIDVSKNGSYNVHVSGKLTVHGVTKDYRSVAEIVVNNGVATAKSVFKVKVADHNIKIPSLVFKNIAEIVEVRIQALYQPKK
ncbi:YceI family protein [Pedobacter sp. SAFR-022]|uniref:YceI family protein n=1 Tax=Pedobacter sp. SAFR-022 TaxID=3436861 RepID=UPI003F81EA0B